MARYLYIGGTDRWGDYIGGSLTIEAALSYVMDTARFQIRGVRPAWGQEVIIEDDTHGRLFGGTVVKVEGSPIHAEPSTFIWSVECDDYTSVVSHKRVTGVFENRQVTALVEELVQGYGGGLTSMVTEDVLVVDRLAWNDKPLSDVLSDLSVLMGWQWWVDYNRVLHFSPVTAEAAESAPLTLIPGGDFRNLKPSIDVQGIQNRVRIVGGLMPSDYTLERTFYGDGTTKTFILPHPKISDVTVLVNSVAKTVGVENLSDEEDYDWMMNYEQGYVRASNQTAAPGNAVPIVVTYRRSVPIVAVVEDTDSQAALAVTLGTDGIVEGRIDDPSILSYGSAVAAGQAELRAWSNPKVSLSFETYTPGWAPGQIVAVDLPDRDLVNQYLVQQVTVTAPTADHFSTKVQAGSTLKGLADFIASLASRASYKEVDPELTVGRVEGFTEVIIVSDSVTITGASYVAAQVGVAQVGLSEVSD